LALLGLAFVLVLAIGVIGEYSWHLFFRWYARIFFAQAGFGYTFDWLGQVELWWWRAALVGVLGLVFWLALHAFRWTLARHAVRSAHLLRVVVLALVAMVLSRALLELADTLYVMWLLPRRRLYLPEWAEACTELVPLALFVVSFMLGLRVYLKLRRGWLMGVLAALIAVTALTVLFLAVSVYRYDSLNNPWTGMAKGEWPLATGLVERAVGFLLIGRWE
jgi:hypothetical protein